MTEISDPFGGYEFQSYREFSADQHRQLAIECEVRDFETHCKLMDTMRCISEYYIMQRNFEKLFGSIKVHRNRLERIAIAASSLQRTLAEEPLAAEILSSLSREKETGDRLDEGERIQYFLIAVMDHLAAKAKELVSSPASLRTYRLEPTDGTKSAKSVERREIWEPVFKLWCNLGKNLGYSDDGPIMRVLEIMHEALKLEPPNPHSVRQAIRQFKVGGVS